MQRQLDQLDACLSWPGPRPFTYATMQAWEAGMIGQAEAWQYAVTVLLRAVELELQPWQLRALAWWSQR